MKKYAKRIFSLVTSFLLVGSLAACGNKESEDKITSETPSNVSTEASIEEIAYAYPKEINIADFASLVHQNLAKLADELGYFDEEFASEGIQVNLVTVDSAAVINEGIASGSIDFAFYGDQPAVNGIANNVGTTILGSNMRTEKANTLMVLPGSEIKSVSDLAGKSIGVSLGTAQHKMVLKMLEAKGLTADEVEFVNLAGANATDAVLAGELDTALVSNQLLLTLSESGALEVIPDATGYPTMNVFVGRTKFIEQYPEITQRYIQVLLRAEKYRNENPEEASRIISEITEEDQETVLKLWPLYEMKLEATDKEIEFLQDTYSFLKGLGTIETDFDVTDYVDFSYVNKAYELEGIEQ